MKNKETGEFELVVGDKQLLSGFFLGVVLLAVVFALGYVLGRNTPKSATVASDTAAVVPNSSSDARPQAASPAVPPSPEPATSTAAAATTPVADTSPPVEAPPQPTTVPAREAKAAAPPADPANSTYWQVTAAASRNSADAVFQTLKDKGFPVSQRPGPNNLTLVWVGPYTDKDTLTRAKKQLEDAGFSPISKHP